jgi:hypothetical protein
MEKFYTAVLRSAGGVWVVLCLENGLVGQGDTKDDAFELFMTFLERDFINAQHPCLAYRGGSVFQCCPTIEDLSSGRVAQPLPNCYSLASAPKA